MLKKIKSPVIRSNEARNPISQPHELHINDTTLFELLESLSKEGRVFCPMPQSFNLEQNIQALRDLGVQIEEKHSPGGRSWNGGGVPVLQSSFYYYLNAYTKSWTNLFIECFGERLIQQLKLFAREGKQWPL